MRIEVLYGNVPKDYVQTTPTTGTAPVLSSGQVYDFLAETTGAPGAEGFFYMDKTISENKDAFICHLCVEEFHRR